jgi:hypothetical protein
MCHASLREASLPFKAEILRFAGAEFILSAAEGLRMTQEEIL